MTRSTLRRFACVAGVCLALPVASLAAPPTIDGQNIPTDFSDAPTQVAQRFQTQFGDNNGNTFGSGSELNRMFIQNDADNMYIGLTGNLENNGNCVIVLFDVEGANLGGSTLLTRTLFPPGAIPILPRYLTGNSGGTGPFGFGVHNMVLDPNFAPDYALGWSGGSPRGSQTRTYYLVNWTTLAADANEPNNFDNVIAGTMTDGDPTASGSSGTLGDFLSTGSTGILGASDNTNADGVSGGTGVADPNNGEPNSATTGFEFCVPLSLMGAEAGDNVYILAFVSSGDGFLANQLLPNGETETDLPNLGPGPDVDLTLLSGPQFICHEVTADTGCPGSQCDDPGGSGGDGDVNDDCSVSLTDLALVLANFGAGPGSAHGDGDANFDGFVNTTDLAIVLAVFGADCSAP